MIDKRAKRDNFANLKANFPEMNNEIYTNNHLYWMDVRHTQKIFHLIYY